MDLTGKISDFDISSIYFPDLLEEYLIGILKCQDDLPSANQNIAFRPGFRVIADARVEHLKAVVALLMAGTEILKNGNDRGGKIEMLSCE